MAQRKNEMTSDDLMQLPDDIAGLVLDVQGRQTQQAAPVQRGLNRFFIGVNEYDSYEMLTFASWKTKVC